MSYQFLVFQPIIMSNSIQIFRSFGLATLQSPQFHYTKQILDISTELLT